MINDLSLKLGTVDKGRTYRILRSVLHTLRDFVSTEESLRLASKLPSFAKIVYEESWEKRLLTDISRPKTIQEFVDKVKENHSKMFLGYDFMNNLDMENSCRMVFGLLKELSQGNTPGKNIIPDRIEKLFGEAPKYNMIRGMDVIKSIPLNYN